MRFWVSRFHHIGFGVQGWKLRAWELEFQVSGAGLLFLVGGLNVAVALLDFPLRIRAVAAIPVASTRAPPGLLVSTDC